MYNEEVRVPQRTRPYLTSLTKNQTMSDKNLPEENLTAPDPSDAILDSALDDLINGDAPALGSIFSSVDDAEPETPLIDREANLAAYEREIAIRKMACIESTIVYPKYLKEFYNTLLEDNFTGVRGQTTMGIATALGSSFNAQRCKSMMVSIYHVGLGQKGSGKDISAKPAELFGSTQFELNTDFCISGDAQVFFDNVNQGDNGKFVNPSNYTPIDGLQGVAVGLANYKQVVNMSRGLKVQDFTDTFGRFQNGGAKGTVAGTRDAAMMATKTNEVFRKLGSGRDGQVDFWRKTDVTWIINEAAVFAANVANNDELRTPLTSDMLRTGKEGGTFTSGKAGCNRGVYSLVPNIAYFMTTHDNAQIMFVQGNPSVLTTYARDGAASRFMFTMVDRSANNKSTKATSNNMQYMMLAASWFGDLVMGQEQLSYDNVPREYTLSDDSLKLVEECKDYLKSTVIPEITDVTGHTFDGYMDTTKTEQLIYSSAPALYRTQWLLQYALPFWKCLLIQALDLTATDIEQLDAINPLENDGWFGLGEKLKADTIGAGSFPGADVARIMRDGTAVTAFMLIYQRTVLQGTSMWDATTEYFAAEGIELNPMSPEVPTRFVKSAIKYIYASAATIAVTALDADANLSLEQQVKTIKMNQSYAQNQTCSKKTSEALAAILKTMKLHHDWKNLSELNNAVASKVRDKLGMLASNGDWKSMKAEMTKVLENLPGMIEVDDSSRVPKFRLIKPFDKGEIQRITGSK